MNKQFAWHFVGDKLRDGRPIPPDGVPLVHTGPMVICESGLHYSYDAFDALQYAPGNTLCYVKVENLGEQHYDKGVCRKRTIIKRRDVSQLLRRFACDQALSVVHLWDAPDVVKQYLRSGDASLIRAARDATRNVGRDAAWAARVAAWGAAWDAARNATWVAAWGAAWAAAQAAGCAAARRDFNSQVQEAFNLD